MAKESQIIPRIFQTQLHEKQGDAHKIGIGTGMRTEKAELMSFMQNWKYCSLDWGMSILLRASNLYPFCLHVQNLRKEYFKAEDYLLGYYYSMIQVPRPEGTSGHFHTAWVIFIYILKISMFFPPSGQNKYIFSEIVYQNKV